MLLRERLGYSRLLIAVQRAVPVQLNEPASSKMWTPPDARPRCSLYATYLERHLL